MKTKQFKVIQAYQAINRIRQRVKGHDALNLFHLKNQLQEIIDFQGEEEQKLVEEYGGVIVENGAIIIEDKDKRKQFQEAYKELQNMEVEVKADRLTLYLDKAPEITLEDIEQLNDYIDFK